MILACLQLLNLMGTFLGAYEASQGNAWLSFGFMFGALIPTFLAGYMEGAKHE